MIDVDMWGKSVPQHEKEQRRKAHGWRLVPVGYLVEYLEERAAIRQHDGGMTREGAERSAVHDGETRFRVYELIFE